VTSPLLDSLRRAVGAAPDDVALRLHLAQLLLEAQQLSEAVTMVAVALQREPGNLEAQQLMARAIGVSAPAPADEAAAPVDVRATDPSNSAPVELADVDDSAPSPNAPSFDWHAAEREVEELAPPMFVDDSAGAEPSAPAYDIERSTVTLADVAGMQDVKDRINAAFLAPLRNPELRRLYGKSLRGGLLLYGPPGCGKTYLARAVAGELGAGFMSVGLSDVLDPYIGNSERNVHEVFQRARQAAPCVLFFDEIDSLGQRRSLTRNNAMRNTVNQMLTELDGIEGGNDGVFVLAATNQPWDVDPALRRPGRLDRTILVLPPDQAAREAIFRAQLQQRPVESIDLARLAKASDGLSGADIGFACELAAEGALLDGVRSGTARLIGMADLDAALATIQPSVNGWLDSARNVVMFGDDDGTYRELKAYLKKSKRW
jgi:SpoVK/Ycf46/Vps4 family AAA+-type ATPase